MGWAKVAGRERDGEGHRRVRQVPPDMFAARLAAARAPVGRGRPSTPPSLGTASWVVEWAPPWRAVHLPWGRDFVYPAKMATPWLSDAIAGGVCEDRLDVVERGGVQVAKGLHVGLRGVTLGIHSINLKTF